MKLLIRPIPTFIKVCEWYFLRRAQIVHYCQIFMSHLWLLNVLKVTATDFIGVHQLLLFEMCFYSVPFEECYDSGDKNNVSKNGTDIILSERHMYMYIRTA